MLSEQATRSERLLWEHRQCGAAAAGTGGAATSIDHRPMPDRHRKFVSAVGAALPSPYPPIRYRRSEEPTKAFKAACKAVPSNEPGQLQQQREAAKASAVNAASVGEGLAPLMLDAAARCALDLEAEVVRSQGGPTSLFATATDRGIVVPYQWFRHLTEAIGAEIQAFAECEKARRLEGNHAQLIDQPKAQLSLEASEDSNATSQVNASIDRVAARIRTALATSVIWRMLEQVRTLVPGMDLASELFEQILIPEIYPTFKTAKESSPLLTLSDHLKLFGNAAQMDSALARLERAERLSDELAADNAYLRVALENWGFQLWRAQRRAEARRQEMLRRLDALLSKLPAQRLKAMVFGAWRHYVTITKLERTHKTFSERFSEFIKLSPNEQAELNPALPIAKDVLRESGKLILSTQGAENGPDDSDSDGEDDILRILVGPRQKVRLPRGKKESKLLVDIEAAFDKVLAKTRQLDEVGMDLRTQNSQIVNSMLRLERSNAGKDSRIASLEEKSLDLVNQTLALRNVLQERDLQLLDLERRINRLRSKNRLQRHEAWRQAGLHVLSQVCGVARPMPSSSPDGLLVRQSSSKALKAGLFGVPARCSPDSDDGSEGDGDVTFLPTREEIAFGRLAPLIVCNTSALPDPWEILRDWTNNCLNELDSLDHQGQSGILASRVSSLADFADGIILSRLLFYLALPRYRRRSRAEDAVAESVEQPPANRLRLLTHYNVRLSPPIPSYGASFDDLAPATPLERATLLIDFAADLINGRSYALARQQHEMPKEATDQRLLPKVQRTNSVTGRMTSSSGDMMRRPETVEEALGIEAVNPQIARCAAELYLQLRTDRSARKEAIAAARACGLQYPTDPLFTPPEGTNSSRTPTPAQALHGWEQAALAETMNGTSQLPDLRDVLDPHLLSSGCANTALTLIATLYVHFSHPFSHKSNSERNAEVALLQKLADEALVARQDLEEWLRTDKERRLKGLEVDTEASHSESSNISNTDESTSSTSTPLVRHAEKLMESLNTDDKTPWQVFFETCRPLVCSHANSFLLHGDFWDQHILESPEVFSIASRIIIALRESLSHHRMHIISTCLLPVRAVSGGGGSRAIYSGPLASPVTYLLERRNEVLAASQQADKVVLAPPRSAAPLSTVLAEYSPLPFLNLDQRAYAGMLTFRGDVVLPTIQYAPGSATEATVTATDWNVLKEASAAVNASLLRNAHDWVDLFLARAIPRSSTDRLGALSSARGADPTAAAGGIRNGAPSLASVTSNSLVWNLPAWRTFWRETGVSVELLDDEILTDIFQYVSHSTRPGGTNIPPLPVSERVPISFLRTFDWTIYTCYSNRLTLLQRELNATGQTELAAAVQPQRSSTGAHVRFQRRSAGAVAVYRVSVLGNSETLALKAVQELGFEEWLEAVVLLLSLAAPYLAGIRRPCDAQEGSVLNSRSMNESSMRRPNAASSILGLPPANAVPSAVRFLVGGARQWLRGIQSYLVPAEHARESHLVLPLDHVLQWFITFKAAGPAHIPHSPFAPRVRLQQLVSGAYTEEVLRFHSTALVAVFTHYSNNHMTASTELYFGATMEMDEYNTLLRDGGIIGGELHARLAADIYRACAVVLSDHTGQTQSSPSRSGAALAPRPPTRPRTQSAGNRLLLPLENFGLLIALLCSVRSPNPLRPFHLRLHEFIGRHLEEAIRAKVQQLNVALSERRGQGALMMASAVDAMQR